MVNSLSKVMSLEFNRIQITPDLMPSDITGTDILQETVEGRREFEFVKGPIFANIILADEINRTTPKTQSSLLGAMSEGQVSIDNETRACYVDGARDPLCLEGVLPRAKAALEARLAQQRLHW